MVDCFVLVDGEETINFIGKSRGRARRGTMNRRPRKSNMVCGSLMALQAAAGDLLDGAMELNSELNSKQ